MKKILIGLITLIAGFFSFILGNQQDVQNPNRVQPSQIEYEVPAYCGTPYVEINDNNPFFTEEDLSTESFESYSEMDALGRCGAAFANISKEIMCHENY